MLTTSSNKKKRFCWYFVQSFFFFFFFFLSSTKTKKKTNLRVMEIVLSHTPRLHKCPLSQKKKKKNSDISYLFQFKIIKFYVDVSSQVVFHNHFEYKREINRRNNRKSNKVVNNAIWLFNSEWRYCLHYAKLMFVSTHYYSRNQETISFPSATKRQLSKVEKMLDHWYSSCEINIVYGLQSFQGKTSSDIDRQILGHIMKATATKCNENVKWGSSEQHSPGQGGVSKFDHGGDGILFFLLSETENYGRSWTIFPARAMYSSPNWK